jgi:hypothetical protein
VEPNEREKAQLGQSHTPESLVRNWRLAVIDLASQSDHGISYRAMRLATAADVVALAATVLEAPDAL